MIVLSILALSGLGFAGFQMMDNEAPAVTVIDAGPEKMPTSKPTSDAGPEVIDAGPKKATTKAPPKKVKKATKAASKKVPPPKKSKNSSKRRKSSTPTSKKSPASSKANGQDIFDDALSEGRIAAKRGNFNGAINSFKKALKIASSNPIANLEIGKAYNELGNHKQAVTYLSKAVRTGIKNPEVHVYLGQAYHGQGNKAKAKKEWETYLRQAPNGKYAKRIKKMLSRL